VLHNKEIGASFTKVTLRYTNNSFAYTSIIEDKDGNIWFGTLHNGVYRCDGNGYIDQFTNADALSKSSVSTIYEDRTGKIWFGTITNDSSFRGHGVFRYDPLTSKTIAPSLAHFTAKDGLCSKGTFSNSSVTCITEDNNGRIWFGGDGGVSYYNGKGFTSFIEKDGMGNYPVKCFVTDRSGFLWLGTWDLGLYRYDGKSFTCFTENASKS
ncbi:MAG: histidine kinase, partial [Flavipsychrobacter sp.]|nr:histidine kinase [Flavipsychrobacter sp.]